MALSTAFTGIGVAEIGGTSGYDTATVINVQTTGATRTTANGTPSQPGLIYGFHVQRHQPVSPGTADTGSDLPKPASSGHSAQVEPLQSRKTSATQLYCLPATFIPQWFDRHNGLCGHLMCSPPNRIG